MRVLYGEEVRALEACCAGPAMFVMCGSAGGMENPVIQAEINLQPHTGNSPTLVSLRALRNVTLFERVHSDFRFQSQLLPPADCRGALEAGNRKFLHFLLLLPPFYIHRATAGSRKLEIAPNPRMAGR